MNARAAQSGTSLIEVLAAVSIFAIVAAGAATGTISTIRGNAASRNTAAAAALIHEKFEQLRAVDATANPVDLTPGVHHDPANPLNELGLAGGIYTRVWTVTGGSPRQGLAEVRVAITWNDGSPRTLSSATYVCQTATCS